MFKTLFIIAIISFVSLSAVTRKENHLQKKQKGKEVYTLHCQSCHMENGQGQPDIYPPLAKTTYVKDVKKNIKIILEGQSGEITVNGKKYNSIMPAQPYLTDQEIADVLTYVRSSWGNKYPAVKPAQVKAERK
jgi:mono/diheme cytochrome c family protein